MGINSDDIGEALGTYGQTGNAWLAGGNLLFGSGADDAATGVDAKDTSIIKEGNETGIATNQTSSVGTQTSTGTQSGVSGNTSVGSNVGVTDTTGSQTTATGTGAFTGSTAVGDTSYDPITGQVTSNLNAGLQGSVDNALGASQGAYDQLAGFNFNDTMGSRYNALEALQEQDRLESQLKLEDRLFAQGRLGSTGGASQQNALLDAIMQQQAMNANTAFGQAQSQQQLLGNQATQFGSAALDPSRLALDNLNSTSALAGTTGVSDTTGSSISAGTNTSTGTAFSDSTSTSDATSTSDVNSIANTASTSQQGAFQQSGPSGSIGSPLGRYEVGTVTNDDGTSTTTNQDGSTNTIGEDGSSTYVGADGVETYTAPNGDVTQTTTNPDGSTAVVAPDGTNTTYSPSGAVLQITKVDSDGNEVDEAGNIIPKVGDMDYRGWTWNGSAYVFPQSVNTNNPREGQGNR